MFSISNIRLTERDYLILKEIDRWRCCLGRHVRVLADFAGQRATDRRLTKLIEAGYITRKKILYGIPGIYQLTMLGHRLIGSNARLDKIRVEQIAHDICVIDTVSYFLQRDERLVAFENIITEKQLHSMDGFGTRKHRPDFVITIDGKNTCVEVELSLKSYGRFEAIVKDNYMSCNEQIWLVPDGQLKIRQRLEVLCELYPNIKIIRLEEALSYANSN